MDFSTLTDDNLDYPFFLDVYDDQPNTLRGYLELYNEDLLAVKIEVEYKDDGITKDLVNFQAWSEDSVFFLNLDLFNAKYLAKVPRNP